MKKIGFFFLLLFILLTGKVFAQENPVIIQSDTLQTDSIISTTDSLVYIAKDSLICTEDSLVCTNDSLPCSTGDSLLYAKDSLLCPEDSLISAKDSLVFSHDSIEQKAPAVIQQHIPKISPIQKKFNQFICRFRNDFNAALERWDDIYLLITGIKPNADYYKLAMPATYYTTPIKQASDIGWKPSDPFHIEQNKDDFYFSFIQLPDLRTSEKVDRFINSQLLKFYVTYPYLVKQNESRLKNIEPLPEELFKKKPKKEKVLDLIQHNTTVSQISEKDLLVIKPNFWTFGGNGYLQFSQNYISDNWYKGGESTKSFLSGLVWQANYDDKQRTQFENKLEWKLGFIAAPSDTVHSYMANNDLLRLSSKFGYKAIKNWYYTLSAEFKTQFFSTYETNSENLISSFFSPAELNIGLGMDYKYVKDGICNLSVLLNPINYTLYSVASDKVDPTKFNIKEGHKKENVWGSRVEATLKWKLFSSLMWESRFSYTTNYEKVLAEWENTFTFVFNKYLSTKLFIHGRFDDGISREPDESYLQLQELLSFGLNYTW